MNDNIAIRVEDVTKKFKVFLDKGVYLKERVLFKNRSRYEERNVLRGISFEVKKGEAIGLIGENGCGKSTTLKLLSRIMYPDSGKVEVNGRVSALIELGAGFHPDMSGRENIYTNAAIFGLSRAEIDRRLQDIISFSELGDYIDNPVRTYSSGMYMRLAFSVAINVDADILLIDEILAVGDVGFQAKCFNKLREIKRNGTTIVIVSHSLGQIEQICDRSYWIDSGLIREQGKPVEVHESYLRYMGERTGTLSGHDQAVEAQVSSGETPQPKEETTKEAKPFEPPVRGEYTSEDGLRWGNNDIVFNTVWLENETGKQTDRLECGRPFRIVMPYAAIRPVEEVVFGIGIFLLDGTRCYGTNTNTDHLEVTIKKEGTVIFEVKQNPLLAGRYRLDIAIHKADGFPYDYCKSCLEFDVYSTLNEEGIVRIEHEWHVD